MTRLGGTLSRASIVIVVVVRPSLQLVGFGLAARVVVPAQSHADWAGLTE